MWGSSKTTLLTVYRALIRSIIDYSCVLYKSASRSSLKKLDTIQCSALRLCLGAMKGTPLSSMLRECDEWPLSTRRDFISLKYIMKLDSLNSHISRSILQNCPMHTLEKKFPARCQADIELLKSLGVMSNLQGVAVSNNPPWTHRPIEVDLSLLNASKNVDVSSILEKQSPSYKQEAIEHIGYKYPDYIYIYTDGSRISIGRVGASVFIPDHDIEL